MQYGFDFRKKLTYTFFERKLLRKYTEGSLTDNDIKRYIYNSDTLFGYPVGRIPIDKRIEFYKKRIVDTADDVFKDFNKDKKYAMKKRVLKRLQYMGNICFFTQTFDSEKIPDNENAYIDYWRKVFKKCKIQNWVLISDFGHKKGRLHFHGFLDLNVDSPYVEVQQVGKKTFYHFVPLKTYGYNKCIFLSNDDNKEIAVNYTLKYMFKDLTFDSRHHLYGSRTARPDIEYMNKLSSMLGVEVKLI